MHGIFFFFISLFFSVSVYGQLINIESRRMHTDSVRFALRNSFDFSYTNNNANPIFSVNNNLTTQAKTKDLKKIFLLSGNYQLIRAKETDFANIWLLHFRFNYKYSSFLRFESFLQTQYDAVLDVSGRHLWGAGIRLKLVSAKALNLYLGNSYMFELENSEKYNVNNQFHRHSAYLSFTANIPKTEIWIVNTFYFQPLYNRLEDFRMLEEFKLDYKINEKISMYSRFNYYIDNITPAPDQKKQFSSAAQFGFSINI